MLDPLLAPQGIIWESFLLLRALLDPTLASLGDSSKFGPILEFVRKKWESILGAILGTNIAKGHKKDEKVGVGTALHRKCFTRP